MQRQRLVSSLAAVCLVLAGLLAAAPPGAAAAVPATFTATPLVGQHVELDPDELDVLLTVTTGGCRTGCTIDVDYCYGRDGNCSDPELVARWSTPDDAVRTRTFVHHVDSDDGQNYDQSYVLGTGDGQVVQVLAQPTYRTEDAFTYDPRWRKDVNVGATETMIQRSTAVGATATLPRLPQARRVGLLSARGRTSGVLAVLVDGVERRRLDLTATRWTPREVVAAVDVPAGSLLQVRNVTPAGRVSDEVHVDGAIELVGGTYRSRAGAPVVGADAAVLSASAGPSAGSVAAAAAPETLRYSVRSPQSLLASDPPQVTYSVTLRYYGCPAGCTLTEYRAGQVNRIPVKTAASTVLQTLQLSRRVPFADGAVYTFQRDGGPVTLRAEFVVLEFDDRAFTYSSGWSTLAGPGRGGSLTRTSTAGAGATFRLTRQIAGDTPNAVGLLGARGPGDGVVDLYVNGVFARTVDLRVGADALQQVVAGLAVPARGRVTVINRTPAGRPAVVRLDGLVDLAVPNDE